MSETAKQRYDAVAMTLHWVIAILIIAMIPFGWWMSDLPNSQFKLEMYQWHKSVGLTILVLSLARLAWRLGHKPPPLPAGMKPWEKTASRAVHLAFYAMIIGTPLMGWALVSASPLNLPTKFFFLFEWPHLPVLPDLARDTKETLSGVFEFFHSKAGWVFIALIAVHVLAALKHQFAERLDLLQRMIPLPFSKSRGS